MRKREQEEKSRPRAAAVIPAMTRLHQIRATLQMTTASRRVGVVGAGAGAGTDTGVCVDVVKIVVAVDILVFVDAGKGVVQAKTETPFKLLCRGSST